MTEAMTSRRLLRVPAAAVALLIGVQGCDNSSSVNVGDQAPAIPTPLATSVDSGQGTLVTVPMGHLGDPENTFWQLFYRPAAASTWSNQVEATATATNSGLLLAASDPQAFVVGIRLAPSLYNYAPLVVTANEGQSWSNGLVSEDLADRPDALATNSHGRALAISPTPEHDTEVLGSAGSYSRWQTLTTLKQLATSTSGRACSLSSLTAVGFLGDSPLVGGSCAHPGVIGLFSKGAGGWQLAGGLAVPPSLDHTQIEILGLEATGNIETALFGVTDPAGKALLAAWTADGGHSWTTSPRLPLKDDQLTSFGQAGGGGLFVLSSTPSNSAVLDLIDGPSATWRPVVAPPQTTATVAFQSGKAVDAFAVNASTLTVWSLEGGGWAKSQVIHVPLAYAHRNEITLVAKRSGQARPISRLEARKGVSAHMDSEITPVPHVLIDTHLGSRESCREYQRALREITRRLGVRSARSAPVGLAGMVVLQRDHRAERAVAVLPGRRQRAKFRPAPRWVVTIAPAPVAIAFVPLRCPGPNSLSALPTLAPLGSRHLETQSELHVGGGLGTKTPELPCPPD